MGTIPESEYEPIWMNPDGSLVSAFKAWDDAILFRQYPNGDLVPAAFFGDEW